MPTTINFLSPANSLSRFPIGLVNDQTAEYLNNNGRPLHSWSAANANITVVSNVVKLPSCNSLLVVPLSTLEVVISLSDTRVVGSISAQRAPLNYMFHCLMLCQEPAIAKATISSRYKSENGKETTIGRNIFDPVRSNIITFDPNLNKPSANYQGSEPLLDVELRVSNHNGSPFYITFPAIIDIDAWKYNSIVPSVSRYVPTMYRDIDEVQDPEYPFFKLVDVLTYGIGDANQIYANWFRFELEDLPVDTLETDRWTKSQLTDPYVSGEDSLLWAAQVAGRKAFRETYAINPNTSSIEAWRSKAYPLDAVSIISADLATADSINIEQDLVVVEKWEPVRTISSTNIDLSSGLVNGTSINNVTVATGDRVLLRHQSTPSQNGIYIVASSGIAARATDADASVEFSDGKAVLVTEGNLANTYWSVSIPSSFTLDTSTLSFSELYSPGVIDGVDLSDGDVVLLTNQDNPSENGVYTIFSSSVAERNENLNVSSQFLDGVHIEISNGDIFSGTIWRLLVERPIIIGVDPVQIFFIDRSVDFLRTQVSTAMYGHAAGSVGALKNACRPLLTGTRSVAIEPNVPAPFHVTVKTISDETLGVDPVDFWTDCRVATVEDVPIAAGPIAGDVIDGIVLAAGDRILIKDQTNPSENGIYIVQSSGSAIRATDADDVSEFVANKAVYIQEGILNADIYFSIDEIPITLEVSDITFQRALTLGSSDVILSALEPARPLGFTFIHQTLNKFSLTFDSPALGRIGTGSLG